MPRTQNVNFAGADGMAYDFVFRFDDLGFAVAVGGAVGLGAVLLLRHAGTREFLMVRKRPTAAYEFSGQWVFPGGMVREADAGQDGGESAVRAALAIRVRDETGLGRPLASGQRFDPPLITRYMAKGAARHTLVLAYAVAVDDPPELPAWDLPTSIDARCWRSPVGVWETLAPANRLFAARALGPELGVAERAAAAWPLEEAVTLCAQWAAEVGLPSAALPRLPWA